MQPAATTRERLVLSIGDRRRYIITIIATATQLESNVQPDPASDVKNVIGKRRSIGVVSGRRYRSVQAQPPDRIVAKRKRQRLIVIDPALFVVKLRCVAIEQIGIERSRDLQMIRGVNSCLIALLRSRCRYAEHSADPSRQRVRSPKDKSPLASNREGVILQQFATGRIEELREIIAGKRNNVWSVWHQPCQRRAEGYPFEIQLARAVVAKNRTGGGYFREEPTGDRRTPRSSNVRG